jgi:hypothetical protein
MHRITIVAVFFVLVIGAASAQEPWVLVIPSENQTGNAALDPIGATVADTISLTLRLLGDFDVRELPAESIPPAVVSGDVAALRTFAAEQTLDYIVFSAVRSTADGFGIDAAVWDRGADAVSVRESGTATSLFSTFDVADDLAVQFLSAFSGQRIAFGQIQLTPDAEGENEYRVLVDGTEVARNAAVVSNVLVGPRSVRVEALDGAAAGGVLLDTVVRITEGQTVLLVYRGTDPDTTPDSVPTGDPPADPAAGETEAPTTDTTDPTGTDETADDAASPDLSPWEFGILGGFGGSRTDEVLAQRVTDALGTEVSIAGIPRWNAGLYAMRDIWAPRSWFQVTARGAVYLAREGYQIVEGVDGTGSIVEERFFQTIQLPVEVGPRLTLGRNQLELTAGLQLMTVLSSSQDVQNPALAIVPPPERFLIPGGGVGIAYRRASEPTPWGLFFSEIRLRSILSFVSYTPGWEDAQGATELRLAVGFRPFVR